MLRPGLLVDVDSIPIDAVLVDTRLALTGPTGRGRYDAGHLPGASYSTSTTTSPLPRAPAVATRSPLATTW